MGMALSGGTMGIRELVAAVGSTWCNKSEQIPVHNVNCNWIPLKSDYFLIQCFLPPRPIRVTYIQPFKKKRGENQAGPLFTIVNCVDIWMIALELDLDHCVFTSLYLNDCISTISGCRYPNESCGKIHWI